MKVSGKVGNPMQSAEAAKVTKTATEGAASKKQSTAADALSTGAAKVAVSGRAQDIAKAKALASPKGDDIDEAKVARLQKLIDEGKYKVDAEAVASRLVDEHLLTEG